MTSSSLPILIAAMLLAAAVPSVSASVPYGSCFNTTEDMMLVEDDAMPAQIGSQHVAIPLLTLWNFFKYPALWPTWNSLFVSVETTTFELCGPLDASYSNGPKCTFPSNFTAPHRIIQMAVSDDGKEAAFAWQFELTDQDGQNFVVGRHTYTLQDAGDFGTTVSSWEKAAGSQVTQCPIGWTVALQESLIDGFMGFVCLERVYQATGGLDPMQVQKTCQAFKP